MIKCENGFVQLDGTTTGVLADFCCIIEYLYKALKIKYGDEYARDMIATCGKLAFGVEDGICDGCVYYDACGDNNRIKNCKGKRLRGAK